MFSIQCSMFHVKTSRRRRRCAIPTSHIAHRTSHTGSRGFTLVELLVVIAIISLLLTVGVPSLKAMFNSANVDKAYTLTSSAVSAARAYAPRKPQVGPDLDLNGCGGAAVFIRNAAGQIEIHVAQNTDYLDASAPTPKQPVYLDITTIDPIVLGESVGVAGIIRKTGSLQLIVPPAPSTTSPYAFAIRFDINGLLIPNNAPSNDTNDVWYNVDLTNPTGNNNKQLDSVIGVVIFNKQDFAGTGVISGANVDTIMNNGTAMLFNRYTGTVMKEQ